MSITAGNESFRKGDFRSAIEEYRKVQSDSPMFRQARFNIQQCLTQISRANTEIHAYTDETKAPVEGLKKITDVYRVQKNDSWTAVITLWRRGDYLKEQLTAIMNQTITPDNIIIIQNESHLTIDRKDFSQFNFTLIKSDLNSLYTRWIIGYLSDSKYVCVFDDDVIPGRKWIELCIQTSNKYNALVGPSGRIAQPGSQPAWKSIETQESGEDELCDWVCNSYFFQTSWIKYVVAADRYAGSQKTYDDIQLATTLKAFGGINTVVPGQPKKNPELNGHTKRQYGHDEHALWKRQPTEHMLSRSQMIDKLNGANFSWCRANNGEN